MLIPHLHFTGNCKDAITLYERAFNIKAETIISSLEYGSNEPDADKTIAHAVMYIHGQKIFLNDRFGKRDTSTNIAVHLIVMFKSIDNFLSCYDVFKDECTIIDPLEKLPYSELSVQFIDKFGVQWGFMVEESSGD